MGTAISGVLTFLVIILLIALAGVGYLAFDDKARIDSDEAKITELNSKLAAYDTLKSQLNSLDSNLGQLEGLLDPEGHERSRSGIPAGARLADGSYSVDMVDPKDCNSVISPTNLAVCIQTISFGHGRTTLHISIASPQEVSFYNDSFIQKCYLEDDSGEKVLLDSLAYEPGKGQSPDATIHKDEIIYRDMVFKKRFEGSARRFQLFWPSDTDGAMITFGVVP